MGTEATKIVCFIQDRNTQIFYYSIRDFWVYVEGVGTFVSFLHFSNFFEVSDILFGVVFDDLRYFPLLGSNTMCNYDTSCGFRVYYLKFSLLFYFFSYLVF